jgi:hypothetical protein
MGTVAAAAGLIPEDFHELSLFRQGTVGRLFLQEERKEHDEVTDRPLR